jgi:hypothetical protein
MVHESNPTLTLAHQLAGGQLAGTHSAIDKEQYANTNCQGDDYFDPS